ncbi:hypothetical protein I4U23_025629 [Adineta vaga]|nr:hypothetical protein I4U23_025629 [Adineta vaga]
MCYELVYRDLFDDYEEERVWCVLRYSPTAKNYVAIIQVVASVSINFISVLLIIVNIACQRSSIRFCLRYEQQLVISPIVLVILLFPCFIIALLSECVKESRKLWLYLFDYFYIIYSIKFVSKTISRINTYLTTTIYQNNSNNKLNGWLL